MGKKIRIVFKSGNFLDWERGDFTDYYSDSRCFVIINGDWKTEYYNLDNISSVTIKSYD